MILLDNLWLISVDAGFWLMIYKLNNKTRTLLLVLYELQFKHLVWDNVVFHFSQPVCGCQKYCPSGLASLFTVSSPLPAPLFLWRLLSSGTKHCSAGYQKRQYVRHLHYHSVNVHLNPVKDWKWDLHRWYTAGVWWDCVRGEGVPAVQLLCCFLPKGHIHPCLYVCVFVCASKILFCLLQDKCIKRNPWTCLSEYEEWLSN